MKTVSGRIVATTLAGSVMVPRRDVTRTTSPVAIPCRSARRGWSSQSGSGYCATSGPIPPGLRSGQVLTDHPPGGEPHRVIVVDLLGRRPVPCRVEAAPAVIGVEAAPLVEALGARVVL